MLLCLCYNNRSKHMSAQNIHSCLRVCDLFIILGNYVESRNNKGKTYREISYSEITHHFHLKEVKAQTADMEVLLDT